MPSPFPGMDPYLEGSEWTSFHADLCSQISQQLNPQLSPKYVARAVRRFVIDVPDVADFLDVYPDVGVFDTGGYGVREVAVAAEPRPVTLTAIIPSKVPRFSVEVFDVANRHLVTAIEVLSPVNKRGAGYRKYVKKRNRLLRSKTHLLEIDLLRRGHRVPIRERLPSAPYYVFLSRVDKRPKIKVWPVQLHMRLPTVPVPLWDDDPDVDLNLQHAMDALYDASRYDLTADYTRPPDIKLADKMAGWAVEHLRAAGFEPVT